MKNTIARRQFIKTIFYSALAALFVKINRFLSWPAARPQDKGRFQEAKFYKTTKNLAG